MLKVADSDSQNSSLLGILAPLNCATLNVAESKSEQPVKVSVVIRKILVKPESKYKVEFNIVESENNLPGPQLNL